MDFEWLSAHSGVQPTSIYQWNGAEEEEHLDAWYYCVEISTIDSFEAASVAFFDKVQLIAPHIVNCPNYQPEIVLHVHAELAQTYFDIPMSMIENLRKFNIPLGISILSWGGVET
jgi:hypothetical protein